MKICVKNKKNHKTLIYGSFKNRGTSVKIVEDGVIITENNDKETEVDWTGFDLSKHYITINK